MVKGTVPVKSFFHLMHGDVCEAQQPELMSSDMWCEEPLLFPDHLLKRWSHKHLYSLLRVQTSYMKIHNTSLGEHTSFQLLHKSCTGVRSLNPRVSVHVLDYMTAHRLVHCVGVNQVEEKQGCCQRKN